MAKTSLFGGGKRSVAGTLAKRSQGRPAIPDIDNAVEALDERASARQRIPDVALEIACPCIDSDQRPIIFRKDFGPLVEQYPHHRVLINQLLVGAESARAGSRSYTALLNLYVGLWEFVTFLNDDRFGLNPMPVMVIADISPSVCLAFSVYLIKVYPRRTLNRQRYSAVGRIVFQMQRSYADNPDIGDTLYWPTGPRKITSPTDGYPSEVMGSLVDGCLKDIRAVIHAHDRAHVVMASGEQIRGEEVTLENIMWWVARLPPALRTVDHLACQTFVKDFCEIQGICPIDLMVTFHDQGEALATHGTRPLGTPIRWTGATIDERIRLAEMVVAKIRERFPSSSTARTIDGADTRGVPQLIDLLPRGVIVATDCAPGSVEPCRRSHAQERARGCGASNIIDHPMSERRCRTHEGRPLIVIIRPEALAMHVTDVVRILPESRPDGRAESMSLCARRLAFSLAESNDCYGVTRHGVGHVSDETLASAPPSSHVLARHLSPSCWLAARAIAGGKRTALWTGAHSISRGRPPGRRHRAARPSASRRGRVMTRRACWARLSAASPGSSPGAIVGTQICKEKDMTLHMSPQKKPKRRRGRQRTGTFPSYKMDKSVRYRSPYERMMYFLLELDVDVVGYEHEPFKITAPFADGEHRDYTPDIRAWCRKGRNRLYEIKGEDYVDDEHTHQQVDIGRAWCVENDHQFLLISSADLRADALMANAELLWDYRWRALPAPFIWECRDLIASLADTASVAALRAHIALTYPSLPPLPAIYNMLFHHHLATDLRQPLGPESLLRCDDDGEV